MEGKLGTRNSLVPDNIIIILLLKRFLQPCIGNLFSRQRSVQERNLKYQVVISEIFCNVAIHCAKTGMINHGPT